MPQASHPQPASALRPPPPREPARASRVAGPARLLMRGAQGLSCPSRLLMGRAQGLSCPSRLLMRRAQGLSCPSRLLMRRAQGLSCPSRLLMRPVRRPTRPRPPVSLRERWLRPAAATTRAGAEGNGRTPPGRAETGSEAQEPCVLKMPSSSVPSVGVLLFPRQGTGPLRTHTTQAQEFNREVHSISSPSIVPVRTSHIPDRDAALSAWWESPLGRALLAAESELLAAGLEGVFGWELRQVGAWGGARELLAGSRTRRQSLIAAPGLAGGADIIARPSRLPVIGDSIDAALDRKSTRLNFCHHR